MDESTERKTTRAEEGATEEHRLELWVRHGPSRGKPAFAGLMKRLQDAQRRGAIDSFSVHFWGPEIDLSPERSRNGQDEVRERVMAFHEWANENGVDLRGFGEPTVAGVGRMGPEYVTERLPQALLVEYVDGDIVDILPCGDVKCAAQWLESEIEIDA